MRIVARRLALMFLFAFVLTAGAITLLILGLLAQISSISLYFLASSDDVVLRYQILSAWTIGVGLISAFIRIIYLIRNRNTHDLRILEYAKHSGCTALFAGGTAFASVALVTATMKEFVDYAVTEILFREVVFYTMIPILFFSVAAYIVIENNIVTIPQSKKPDSMERDIEQICRFLIKHIEAFVAAVKKKVGR